LEGKEELESNFDECVEELGRVQGAEEKHQATIQRQTAQIESLKTSLAKLKAELAQKDTKISEILDEKFESETALQERIYRLESEIKSLSNGHKEDKSNYESMIKALKEQLNTANQSCEEEKASLVKGMEEMKDGFTQSIDVYKQKVADLESRLDLATQQYESITKEFSDTKSLFAMRLEECNREKNEVVSKLEQANKEYGSAKAARGKDINMLESELEKALASKLETDKQLKDTRRQLHNALHSLDAMSIDGGKTRADLEDIMKHLNTEKDLLHRELVELRYQTEEQKNTIKYLNLDKRRCEESCDALRSKIRELEAKGHFGSSDEREMMQLEIKYLKNMLDKANTINSSSTKCGKNESNRALEEQVEQLRASEKSRAAELSQARQMIQKLKTKEKYLESRVESLANQITLTVQEYETRLGEAREMGHI
jgi:chromosome segregation ATPase